MAAMTIRQLSDDAHRALKARATKAGRSTEAEARLILEAAALQRPRLKLGDEIHQRFMKFGGVDLRLPKRSPTPKPIVFE